jgi:post-segregation antitoxin (ccd killing protein)
MMAEASRAAPVLFLDFDGVLHPLGEIAIDEYGQLIRNPYLFVWMPVIEQILDPFPQIRIVVSSDWRRLFDDASLVTLLGPLGVRFDGVVETWGPSRLEEIRREAVRRQLTHWVALDDHPSVHEAARTDPRLIACASDTGLSARPVQQALQAALGRLAADHGLPTADGARMNAEQPGERSLADGPALCTEHARKDNPASQAREAGRHLLTKDARRALEDAAAGRVLTLAELEAVRRRRAALDPAEADRLAAAWLEENREAIDCSNAYIEEHGLPLAKYRLF